MESRSHRSTEIFQSSQLISLNPRFLTLSSRPYMKWPQSLRRRLTALCPGRLASISLAPHMLPMPLEPHAPQAPGAPPTCEPPRGRRLLSALLRAHRPLLQCSPRSRLPGLCPLKGFLRFSVSSIATNVITFTCVCMYWLPSAMETSDHTLGDTEMCSLVVMQSRDPRKVSWGHSQGVSCQSHIPLEVLEENLVLFFFFKQMHCFCLFGKLSHSLFFFFLLPPTLFFFFFFAAPGLGCGMPAPLVTACGI